MFQVVRVVIICHSGPRKLVELESLPYGHNRPGVPQAQGLPEMRDFGARARMVSGEAGHGHSSSSPVGPC